MECPKCRLINPPGSIRCDCGYSFVTGVVSAVPSTVPDATLGGGPSRIPLWRKIIGWILLLWGSLALVSVGMRHSSSSGGGLPVALGHLAGDLVDVVLIVVGLGLINGRRKRKVPK